MDEIRFGAMEPKSVQALKLNALVAKVDALTKAIEEMKGGKVETEKPAAKKSKKTEEKQEAE